MGLYLDPAGSPTSPIMVIAAPGATVPTTVETVVYKLFVPAGYAQIGSTIEFWFMVTKSISTAHTCKMRIGATGTVSDQALQTFSTTAAAAGSAHFQGVGAVASVGSAATFIANAMSGGSGGTYALSNNSVATSSFNADVANWISVTLTNGTSSTTTVRGGVLRAIHP